MCTLVGFFYLQRSRIVKSHLAVIPKVYGSNTGFSKSLCAPDDYSTKKHAKFFETVSITIIT
jgi:hypothetical protein